VTLKRYYTFMIDQELVEALRESEAPIAGIVRGGDHLWSTHGLVCQARQGEETDRQHPQTCEAAL